VTPYISAQAGTQILTIYTEAQDAGPQRKARIGRHPWHGRTSGLEYGWHAAPQLAEHGYTTLSIQMPVLANDAEAEAYQSLFPEAEERIAVAVDFYRPKVTNVIVSHSMGSAMSRYMWRITDQAGRMGSLGRAWLLLFRYTHPRVSVREHDLPPVLNMARSAQLHSRVTSIPGSEGAKSDHFYNNHETEMVEAVNNFLGSIK
jgi:hypothetical protein